MICKACGVQNRNDSVMCSECGYDYDGEIERKDEITKDKVACDDCNKDGIELFKLDQYNYCIRCYEANTIDKIIMTTTNSVEGQKIDKYIGIDAAEYVIGTGPISELTTSIQDIFGARSSAFEEKLEIARMYVMKKLKMAAYKKGGNAVVGVDLDYTEFSGNRIGVIVSGTIVITGKYISNAG